MDTVRKRNVNGIDIEDGNEIEIEDTKQESWSFWNWVFPPKTEEENRILEKQCDIVRRDIDSVKRDIGRIEESLMKDPSDEEKKKLDGHMTKAKRVLDLVEYELYWLKHA
jgi:hypothetical protein